jgi:hypothetical protein
MRQPRIEPHPSYDVLRKWDSPSFDDTTRTVIARRLHAVPARRFLTEAEWALLEAVVARLIPQSCRSEPVPITPWIDERLAENRGEGFRYEHMPPLREAWRLGLAALDAQARRRHGAAFVSLPAEVQDVVLGAIQRGDTENELWAQVPARRFFADVLLKTAAGIYYGHPAAWSEVGFGGPASPRGYVRLGPDERDPWEAKRSHGR